MMRSRVQILTHVWATSSSLQSGKGVAEDVEEQLSERKGKGGKRRVSDAWL